MEKNNTAFDFFTDVFVVFAISLLTITVLSALIGEDAKEISKIFKLGNEGIAISTIFQFFLMSFIIISIRTFFLSDIIIRNMAQLWRIVWMVLIICLVIVGCVLVFDWFPFNNKKAWIAFAFAILGSFIASTSVMLVKLKMESKKYEELLLKYQEKYVKGESADE